MGRQNSMCPTHQYKQNRSSVCERNGQLGAKTQEAWELVGMTFCLCAWWARSEHKWNLKTGPTLFSTEDPFGWPPSLDT